MRRLLRHAIFHRALDWLHGTAMTTIERFTDRCHTRSLALLSVNTATGEGGLLLVQAAHADARRGLR